MLSPHGPVGPTGHPAASTWMLSLLTGVLAPQPEAGGGTSSRTSSRADQRREDPCSLWGPCGLGWSTALLHHPHAHGTIRRGWALVRYRAESPPGSAQGEESQILATQSGASPGPAPAPPPVGLPASHPHLHTVPGPRAPFPAPLSSPSRCSQTAPNPPYLQASKAAPLPTHLANPGEARDSLCILSTQSRRFWPLCLGIPTPKRGLG